MKTLTADKELEIRFSEVDSMNVVWHGSYSLYFEDARETFGAKYELSYQRYFDEGFFAPLVELNFHYRKPLLYGMRPRIQITYIPSEAAKIVFDYKIYNPDDGEIYATGHSVQVFMDHDYQLVWFSPEFFEQWKQKWLYD